MSQRHHYIFAFILILAAAMSRVLPHPQNFAPIGALALFGGAYFNKKFATIVPLAALLAYDYFIGFHALMVWVYGSFFAVSLMGMWLKNHKSVGVIAGTTLAGSILFFVVTNFGVWAAGYYPQTTEGLVACYIAAIPLFHNTVAGDLFYVAVLFGAYELLIHSAAKRRTVDA